MIAELAATEIENLMAKEPVSVAPSTKLSEVVDGMKNRYGACLVCDGDKLVGIFTERDLMFRVDHDGNSWRDLPVGEVMTTTPRTLTAKATIAEAIAMMTDGMFRHIPIVDEAGQAVGIVSIRDIMTYAVGHFPQEFINLPPGPESEARGRWGG
jgi:CBS domain-containing protein